MKWNQWEISRSHLDPRWRHFYIITTSSSATSLTGHVSTWKVEVNFLITTLEYCSFLFVCRQARLGSVHPCRTCFELRAFYTPHLNWYMSAFLLHSSAASACLRVLSVYGGAIVTAFSIVTMTLYRWSSQFLRAIAVTITHAHSLPHLLPRRWDIAGTEIAG